MDGSILLFLTVFGCLCSGGLSICVGSERLALLKLKQGLKDPMNELSSWKGSDCCSWTGVLCDNGTGNVVRLHLDGLSLGGELHSALQDLKFLQSLNLSMNDFAGIRIPGFIGSLSKLRQLDLSNSNFGGVVPSQLGNLSSLRYLNLGSDVIASLPGLSANNLEWIANLSSLRFLGMAAVNLSMVGDWLLWVNKLPSLLELHLPACGIDHFPASPLNFNLTSLNVLDLSSNEFNSSMPGWLFNMTSLIYLDLSGSLIVGSIPDAFQGMAYLAVVNLKVNSLEGMVPRTMSNLCSLTILDLSINNMSTGLTELVEGLSQCQSNSKHNLTILNLSHNLLRGPVPSSLSKLYSLEELYLQDNHLNGTVPESLAQLSSLRILDVSSNNLVGVISEAHFAKMIQLKELYMSLNSLSLKVSPNWTPPFQLTAIYLPSCQLGPLFPAWLQTQKNYTKLDMSNASISDTMPSWFWGLTSQIAYLNLSLNHIKGNLPLSLESVSIELLDISSNSFEGPLPRLDPSIVVLNFYGNSFSGPLPPDIGAMMPAMRNLLLSNNILNGSIPKSICDLQNLQVLGLSNNLLSGKLPDCWNNSQLLAIMDVGNNNISGDLPDSLGSITSLKSLHLNNNSLSGRLPMSWQNCTSLVALDLGENRLYGKIPTWIGESLSNLMILRLHSNSFTGSIPMELSLLASLQVLDIANNALSSSIPQSFGNFTAMTKTESSGDFLYVIWGSYEDNVLVFIKGRELEYSKNLALVTSMDLSSNKLVGPIPEELANLAGLYVLDLSGNMLTGVIPRRVGNLISMESLDLSRNNLTGAIPPSLATLTYLSHLNLSFNNLKGRIPSGFQLQTLGNDSYIGNPFLCGSPLTNKCPGDDAPPSTKGSGNDDIGDTNESQMVWFYSGIAPGFAVGCLIVWGTMFIKSSWRIAFFRMTNEVFDWVYIVVATNKVIFRSRNQ